MVQEFDGIESRPRPLAEADADIHVGTVRIEQIGVASSRTRTEGCAAVNRLSRVTSHLDANTGGTETTSGSPALPMMRAMDFDSSSMPAVRWGSARAPASVSTSPF